MWEGLILNFNGDDGFHLGLLGKCHKIGEG